MIYTIPGRGKLELKTIILDLNGTISVGGSLVKGIDERLGHLKELGYKIVLFTGNTRNDADGLAQQLGIDWRQATSAQAKADIAHEFEPETCVSIGNGRIDLELMKVVELRIVTLQAEGVHLETMMNSDIVVPSIKDALDILIDPDRLVATLRC